MPFIPVIATGKYRTASVIPVLILLLLTGQTDLAVGEDNLAPVATDGKVCFIADLPDAVEVSLAGDFNSWSAGEMPMKRGEDGLWRIGVPLAVGFHEYKYIVDGNWLPDPANPEQVMNNYGEYNSVLYMNELGQVELRGPVSGSEWMVEKSGGEGVVYLALIWHQHQPFYLDASKDQLIAPWVRTHTTKDYYDMTAMLKQHPGIHCTMNLTPVLLYQLEEYYVNRLGPYYDETSNRIRSSDFMDNWKGRTDPWVDLMFTETADFGPEEDTYLFRDEWSCFSISHVIMERFPEYLALRDKDPATFTVEDKRDLKCFFWLANFDPRFLRGPVELITGQTVDLSDLVTEKDGPLWRVGRHFSEHDANRLVAEFYKIAAAVIPLHKVMNILENPRLTYSDTHRKNCQVEVITTPFFHPILPLINNVHSGLSGTDEALGGLEFSYRSDARAQVGMAIRSYRYDWFEVFPAGMWPAEGAVSHDVVDLFTEKGIEWIATGDGVLRKSTPSNRPADTPYRVTGENSKSLAVFFRDTHLSDLVGFRYQRWDPEVAAEDLVRQIMSRAPEEKDRENLVTILLDGENAWEWYEKDPDAIHFLHSFYGKLEELQEEGRLITVTPFEYLHGNPDRGIEAHPVESLPQIERLWSGSWIRADFSTWIGEPEENRAWEWLSIVRKEIDRTIDSDHVISIIDSSGMNYGLMAKQAMYAAEGSDWFWWYGADQNTGEGDNRWDKLYRTHLLQVYENIKKLGYVVVIPEIPCLMNEKSDTTPEEGGAMTPGQ